MKKFTLLVFLTTFYFVSHAQTTTSPTKTKGCVEGDCISITGKYLFDNGDKYNGEWVNGLRNGYGRYDYHTGEWYLGDFKNDTISGQGNYRLLDGKWISGKWKNYVLIEPSKETDPKYLNFKIPVMARKSEMK